MTGEPELRGVVPVMVTPFAPDGSIDIGQFDRQVDFLRSSGVRWVGLGYGSEVPRLRPDELTGLVTRVAERSEGALRVVGNAEIASVPAGVEAVGRIADAGGNMVMARLSGMSGLPEAAVVDVIAEVASRGSLPIVVQDAPQSTGVELSAATLARLVTEIPEVGALKVEPPIPAPKIAAVVRALDGAPGTILGGAGGVDFLRELQRGAVGTMPSPGFHEVFGAIQRRFESGDVDGAFDIWSRALPLTMLCARDLDTLVVVQKYLLTRRGVLDGHALRPPHSAIDPDLLADAADLVERIGLWELIEECGGRPLYG